MIDNKLVTLKKDISECINGKPLPLNVETVILHKCHDDQLVKIREQKLKRFKVDFETESESEAQKIRKQYDIKVMRQNDESIGK